MSATGIGELAALAAFAFVSAATPGPNNVMLWASGIQFGLRPTLPHVLGTSVGIGMMAIGVEAGLGIIITTVPPVELAFKVIGSAYLLYLAYRVTGIHAVQQTEVAHPLRLGQAALFQVVNPKAWVFVVAAFTTFRPSGLPSPVASAWMILTMVAIVLPSALLWAAGGGLLAQFINTSRAQRVVAVALGLLLAGTVVLIWI